MYIYLAMPLDNYLVIDSSESVIPPGHVEEVLDMGYRLEEVRDFKTLAVLLGS